MSENKIDDGGPAFPNISKSITTKANDGEHVLTHEIAAGMTLRDYFAAAALPECIRTSQGWCDAWTMSAVHAYKIADAMILRRSAK